MLSKFMKLAVLAAVAAATISPAQAQTCQDEKMCKAVGGVCGTPNDDSVCFDDFLGIKLCAEEENCKCCIPDTCSASERCTTLGGECIKRGQCTLPDEVWVHRLCNTVPNPLQQFKCGCCIKELTPSPTPAPTDVCRVSRKCRRRNGECMDEEECTGDRVWDTALCIFGGCGCCYKPKCPQTDICTMNGGECKDKRSCENRNKPHFWAPKLCIKPGGTLEKDCGCCIPKPVATCKQTRGCEEANGSCMGKKACRKRRGEWKDDMCSKRAEDCGCCIE